MNKFKTLTIVLSMLSMPLYSNAQSVGTSNNTYKSAYYEQWRADYETTGAQINEISEVYDQQVAKRGYPKKKTVKAKMTLIEHYVQLLQTQLTDPRLNEDVDKGKIQRKIDEWQTQYVMLQALL